MLPKILCMIDRLTLGSRPCGPDAPRMIDGPFVPHNLISTQESPVPFPRFQMAPWLKSWWPSGPKKEPGYTFLFPQKPRQRNPSRFPTRAPMKREVPLEEPLAERCPTTRAFLHSSIQILGINPPPHIGFPDDKGAPASRNACIPRLS
jgi:hypothetical protein